MPRPVLLGSRLAPLVLVAVTLSMACLQGAKAPQVAPRGTLNPGDLEAELGKSEGPFGVVFAAPRGPTVDPSEITLVWNRPLRALETAGEEAPPPVVIKPAVRGRWSWVGTSGLSFVPESQELPRATEFTVEVPAGTRSLDGAAMDKPFVLRFSTVRPSLVSVRASGDADSDALAPSATFELRFNQPVDQAEIARAVSLTVGASSKIAFDLKRSDPKNEQLIELIPRARLPLDTQVLIAVDAKLRGREGPLLADKKQEFKLHTYGPLKVLRVSCDNDTPNKRCSAGSGVSIELSNPVKFADLKRAIRFEPAVKIRWPSPSWLDEDQPTQTVSLWGRFSPGKTYRVRVSAAGVKDIHGQPLGREWSEPVAFDDLWPSAEIGVTGSLVEPSSVRGIPIASVNAREIDLATAPLTEAAILALEADPHRPGRLPLIEDLKKLPGSKSATLQPGAPPNRPAEQIVKPEDVLGGKDKRGPLAISIAYTERPGTRLARIDTRTRVVQVTDLAISAKLSARGSLVWVTHLGSGAPAPGASVSIVRPGQTPAEVFKTDASGFASIPSAAFIPAQGVPERAVIFARLGEDWTYRRAAEAMSGYRFGVSLDLGPDRPFGMLFTDRGIYRPGETVRIKGIFREEARSGTSTPAGRAVEVTVEGPDGDTIAKVTPSLTPFGTLAVDVTVPETGRLGTYALLATVQGSPRGSPDVSADFEVAEYRPAEFKVGVESDKPSYIRGDKATWTASGDYLFGAPMANASVRLAVSRSETWFMPPGLADAGFLTNDSTFMAGRSDGSPREYQIQTANSKLDLKGTASLTASLALPGQTGPELVNCEADVTDLSRQLLSGSTSAIVHPGEFYVALDPGPDLFLKPGDAVKPRVLAVDPKGGHVGQVAVTIELIQRKWTVAKEEVSGGFRSVSTTVDKLAASCAVTTSNDPVSCSLAPSGAGYYVLRARATDRRKNPLAASAGLYVTGDAGNIGWGGGWSDSDRMQVELVPDRKSYEVGQTAHVLVKSPFKSAEALITVERAGLYSQRRMTLSGPMPTIDIPVTEDHRPNTFVSVLLIRGRSKPAPAKIGKADIGAPAFRVGYAALPVNPEARRLTLALKPSRTDLRPGDTLDVDVDVKDRAGKPARAEVTLYAVDEGVLSLIGYKTPDPVPIFGAPRALKVATIEAREILARVKNPLQDLGLDKGLEGGDGGGDSSVRRDFRASAYFNPTLHTDAEGHIHASFKLPDGLTTYRLMAVAAAQDDRFGFAEARVTTSRPLMARPAFPRFLRAGDHLDAGVVITAKGLPRQRVDVEIAANGLTLKEAASKSIDLDANGSAEVRFALDAPRSGKATVRFKVKGSGKGAEDAVEITRDVKVPMVMEAVALYGDTTQASAEKLGDLSSIRDDVGELSVSLSSTALVGLGGGVEHLIEYPYGCTEQLTSRLVPLLPLRDLAADYKVALPKNLDLVISKTVAEILTHQRGDGGFGIWAESPEANAWVTAYALWGLSIAKRHRVPVPETALTSATDHLRDSLAKMEKDPYLLASAPFILDVLAENGAPDPGRVSALFEGRSKLPLFAQAQLLHAMVLSKSDRQAVETLAGEIEGHLRLDANTARAVENQGDRYAVLMDSDTRTSALVLRGLLAARSSHPLAARLARGLLAARRGGAWRNTQETAWSLLALDAYRKAEENAPPDFIARVFLGQAEIWSAPFRGRSLEQPRTTLPAANVISAGGASLAFDVDGKGRLFYEARLRYAKKVLPSKPLERGFFLKKTLRVVRPEGLEEALKTVPEASTSTFKGSDLILADLVVVTPSPREFVVIDDPLPAGFEAVDARLATTGAGYNVDDAASRSDADDDEPSDDEVAVGTAYRPSRFLREIRDDRVLFFIDHLPAGIFRYRYLARATTLGAFVVPPTKAEEMYSPEVFGRTAAQTIQVTGK
jgi:alpha-2-macroglobulin